MDLCVDVSKYHPVPMGSPEPGLLDGLLDWLRGLSTLRVAIAMCAEYSIGITVEWLHSNDADHLYATQRRESYIIYIIMSRLNC
jgi:hypothetical protein